MGRFLIFLMLCFVLGIIALALWWIGSKIYISIKRKESMCEIEQEAHEKMKQKIREEE